jgi:hypothetical protein
VNKVEGVLTVFLLVLPPNPNSPTQNPQIPNIAFPIPTPTLTACPTLRLLYMKNAERERREEMVRRIDRRRAVVGGRAGTGGGRDVVEERGGKGGGGLFGEAI